MSLNQTALEAKRYGVFTCQDCKTLGQAARVMVAEDVSALVITDAEGCLAGILSRVDLMRAALEHADWQAQPIEHYMSAEVVTISEETTLREAAEILLDHRIHRVVVVRLEGDKQRPLSVISAADVVYHMLKDIQ